MAMARTRAGLGRVEAAVKHAQRRCPFLHKNPGVVSSASPVSDITPVEIQPPALKLLASKCPVMAPVIHSPGEPPLAPLAAAGSPPHPPTLPNFCPNGMPVPELVTSVFPFAVVLRAAAPSALRAGWAVGGSGARGLPGGAVHPAATSRLGLLQSDSQSAPLTSPSTDTAMKLGQDTLTTAAVATAHEELMTTTVVQGHTECTELDTPPLCPVTNTIQVPLESLDVPLISAHFFFSVPPASPRRCGSRSGTCRFAVPRERQVSLLPHVKR